MKQIYKGPIHKLRIHSVNPIIKTTAFESTIIVKDSLFYKNRIGKFINLEYNTVLPTAIEAETNLLEISRIHQMNAIDAHCIYANNLEIKPYKQITKQEFKTLKKTYKRK